MDAKSYLQQISMYDELIVNKTWELQKMRHSAEGMTSYAECVTINGELHAMDKVQSSGSLQPMADKICSYLDMARKIELSMIEWEKKKQDIISTIQTLPEAEYKLLHRVYVRGMCLQDVATECSRSYSWAKSVHISALKNVQRILDERDSGTISASN